MFDRDDRWEDGTRIVNNQFVAAVQYRHFVQHSSNFFPVSRLRPQDTSRGRPGYVAAIIRRRSHGSRGWTFTKSVRQGCILSAKMPDHGVVNTARDVSSAVGQASREIVLRFCFSFLTVLGLLWLAILMYLGFYYAYMPTVRHVKPVHLQFQ